MREGLSALLPGDIPGPQPAAAPSSMEYLDGRRISLEFEKPEQLELDGDGAGAVTTATFEVMPGTLRVVC